jgi:hypothetical protein
MLHSFSEKQLVLEIPSAATTAAAFAVQLTFSLAEFARRLVAFNARPVVHDSTTRRAKRVSRYCSSRMTPSRVFKDRSRSIVTSLRFALAAVDDRTVKAMRICVFISELKCTETLSPRWQNLK